MRKPVVLAAALLLLLALCPARLNSQSDVVAVNGYATAGTVSLNNPGAAPVFDGSKGVVFVLAFNTDVIGATMVNIKPGQLYTFELIQSDPKAAHLFNYPPNWHGGIRIAPKIAGITVAVFVGLTNQSLIYIGGGGD